VLVVERDRLPAAFVPRRGVPEGRHAHGLLGGALLVLERYLPGIAADLAARGAPVGDPARDTRWFVGGGHLAPFASGWRGVWASRPLLEGTVRDRLLALPNVRLLDHTDAVGLRVDGGRVTGARVLRAANGSTAELVPADLVVDATGRGSRCPAWLAELGYEPPVEERVDAGATYVSRLFRRGPDGPLAHVMATPSPERRLGILTAQEGGVWLATMAGYRGERPPADVVGFRAYAASLPATGIPAALAAGEPIGDAAVGSFPLSVRHRWDRLRRLPGGLLAIGDAVSSREPGYGQGIALAARQAVALDTYLEAGAARYFAAALAAERCLTLGWYPERVCRAARDDETLARAVFAVLNLVRPARSLRRPALAARVLVAGHGCRAGTTDTLTA
jgi:2-polyprenyl-6-methoxyphenol hydroxylase-like FAD-dependent oxidoreductase